MLAMDSQTAQDLPEPWFRLDPEQAAFFEREAATEIVGQVLVVIPRISRAVLDA